jgi:uridylate kinase
MQGVLSLKGLAAGHPRALAGARKGIIMIHPGGRFMGNVTVISLGGSLIAPAGGAGNRPGKGVRGRAKKGIAAPPPERVDVSFLSGYRSVIERYLGSDHARKLIMVTGGGSLAREYQRAFTGVVGSSANDDLDWIGISATRVNGELVRRLFRQWCVEEVVADPTAVSVFPGRVMVAAGWKPGFSTDYDAVVLAQRFQADSVVNLSDIAMVYSDDPRKNPSAKPLERLSWAEFRGIIGGEWVPGKKSPFDPIAARLAEESHIRVIVAQGRDFGNLEAILEGKSFTGTTIGPD